MEKLSKEVRSGSRSVPWLTGPYEILFPLVSLILLIAIGWIGIALVEREMKDNLAEELRGMLRADSLYLKDWVRERKSDVSVWAQEAHVRNNILELLKEAQREGTDPERLIHSAANQDLRKILGPVCSRYGFIGFVVFNREGLQVGALLDAPVGLRDIIRLSDFVKRSFQGEVVFSPPFPRDIPLPDSKGNMQAEGPTQFVSAPIKDDGGQVAAVLAFRLSPELDFSQVTRMGRTGQTGESYIFDREGRFLTESRFLIQLENLGLLAEFPKGGTILNIQVRDPGGNLLEGYLPSLPMKNRPLTVMAASAVKGNSGINVDGYRDYRGVRVVGAWTWLREFDFGLTMEIDVTEAHAPLIAMQKNFAALFSILVLVTGISLTMRSRHIQMARERMRMLKELKEAQVSLEQRIQERTTELRETNLRLEQEVGERMRSEQDLRNSDTRLRTILNSTLDGIITIDEQGIVEMLNPGAEKIFGYPADEVVGKPVGILMPEPYASEYYQYVRKYVDSGKRTLVGFRRELPGLRKDGSTFVLDLALNEMFLAGRRLFVGTMRDVSERKESEEWLRKLSRAVEQSSCMVMITDVQGQIEYVNPRFCEVTGFDLLEVIGKNPRFLKPAHYPPEIFKQLWETITHGREWKGEFYNVRKNGDLYWESASISPVLDKKGKVTHFLAIKEDISERKKSEELVRKANEELEGRVGERTQKLLSMNRELQNEISIRQQAEEALRESEARVRSILNNAIDGIIAINDQGNMETFNPAAERVFGFNRSEVIGKSITMLMPPDLRKLHVNGFHRYLRTGVPKLIGKGSIRLRGLKKNGEEFPLELGVSEFKVQGKSFFTGIVRDVTDREKAAADLDLALKNAQQARDWIDGILKSMAEGLIVTDSEFRVVMINSAAQNILKVSAEEVMDKSLNEIISSKDFWNQVHGFISAFTEGQPFDFELNHSASGPGTIFRVHMSLLVDRENKTSGLILAMHDVSQERRMERIKTEFISTAAHELRTPLTSIRGFSELLMTRSYDNSEKVQRFISRINSEAENLANIINDLLDISRIESEQGFLLRRSYFQLDELIETETFFFQEQYRSHRFDNHFPGKKIVCWMDKDKLEQVLKNLYSNAVKYSPHGGEIKTEIIIKENDYVVCIEDQGIGMRPDELHRMFDKFYRGEQIRSQVPGTGLGMTIVKHIIEEHGGKIWVESEVGKGTKVWFSIPITRLTPSTSTK